MTCTPEERLEIEREVNGRIMRSITTGDFQIHGLKWDTIINGIYEMRRLAPGNLEQRVEEIVRLKAAEARVAELEAALQETLWQIEHDPPLLPQAKAIAQVALKGRTLTDGPPRIPRSTDRQAACSR